MPNSLYKQLNGGGSNPMLQRLRTFKQSLTGDPRQMVQGMINSGRISQDQVNKYAHQADEIYRQLRGFF